MTLMNELEASETVSKDILAQFIIMLSPFAPHLSEHLWEKIGGEGSVHQQSWPDVSLIASSENEVIVQVAGRKRGSILLPSEAGESEALAEALKLPAVATALGGEKPKRVVFVAGKIINLVV